MTEFLWCRITLTVHKAGLSLLVLQKQSVSSLY